MDFRNHKILLADDDSDDCLFFEQALEELPLSTSLKTVNNGTELLDFLIDNSEDLPDVLFLDLNMPRKTGFECLSEIKENEKLRHLPVIIFSTSSDIEVMNSLYEKGAMYYIRKPAEFSKLRKVIYDAINIIAEKKTIQPAKEEFVLQP